jgi:heavy metal sensor kinase
MAPELANLRRSSYWLAGLGAGVMILGLAGGWWLAARAIRPIEDISAAATQIATGDLSHRIAATDTDTELGRLAAVLNSTFSRLDAAFTHQAQFTSDASHELRTPVSVILTQTQTALARERSAADYRETLEACQRAAQRMRRLIESLLELARLDAGQDKMKRETFDLARVVQDSIDLVRPLAAARKIEVRCSLDAAHCIGDPERIAQVVVNLLTNAIHHNKESGEVKIGARADNRTATITISDGGPGIAPKDLPHIFERFYRADSSRTAATGGAGLGLAIAKAIVDGHGGTIKVESELGAGATFTVRLPVAAAHTALS